MPGAWVQNPLMDVLGNVECAAFNASAIANNIGGGTPYYRLAAEVSRRQKTIRVDPMCICAAASIDTLPRLNEQLGNSHFTFWGDSVTREAVKFAVGIANIPGNESGSSFYSREVVEKTRSAAQSGDPKLARLGMFSTDIPAPGMDKRLLWDPASYNGLREGSRPRLFSNESNIFVLNYGLHLLHAYPSRSVDMPRLAHYREDITMAFHKILRSILESSSFGNKGSVLDDAILVWKTSSFVCRRDFGKMWDAPSKSHFSKDSATSACIHDQSKSWHEKWLPIKGSSWGHVNLVDACSHATLDINGAKYLNELAGSAIRALNTCYLNSPLDPLVDDMSFICPDDLRGIAQRYSSWHLPGVYVLDDYKLHEGFCSVNEDQPEKLNDGVHVAQTRLPYVRSLLAGIDAAKNGKKEGRYQFQDQTAAASIASSISDNSPNHQILHWPIFDETMLASTNSYAVQIPKAASTSITVASKILRCVSGLLGPVGQGPNNCLKACRTYASKPQWPRLFPRAADSNLTFSASETACIPMGSHEPRLNLCHAMHGLGEIFEHVDHGWGRLHHGNGCSNNLGCLICLLFIRDPWQRSISGWLYPNHHQNPKPDSRTIFGVNPLWSDVEVHGRRLTKDASLESPGVYKWVNSTGNETVTYRLSFEDYARSPSFTNIATKMLGLNVHPYAESASPDAAALERAALVLQRVPFGVYEELHASYLLFAHIYSTNREMCTKIYSALRPIMDQGLRRHVSGSHGDQLHANITQSLYQNESLRRVFEESNKFDVPLYQTAKSLWCQAWSAAIHQSGSSPLRSCIAEVAENLFGRTKTPPICGGGGAVAAEAAAGEAVAAPISLGGGNRGKKEVGNGRSFDPSASAPTRVVA